MVMHGSIFLHAKRPVSTTRSSSDKRLFTAASQESEKGYEYPAWSNSVWTGLLVDEAMFQGKADGNGDGHVTLSEAIPYAMAAGPRHDQGPAEGCAAPLRGRRQ